MRRGSGALSTYDRTRGYLHSATLAGCHPRLLPAWRRQSISARRSSGHRPADQLRPAITSGNLPPRSRPLHTRQTASQAERYRYLQTPRPGFIAKEFNLHLYTGFAAARRRSRSPQRAEIGHGARFAAYGGAVANMGISQNDRAAKVAFTQHQPDKPQPVSVASENRLPQIACGVGSGCRFPAWW